MSANRAKRRGRLARVACAVPAVVVGLILFGVPAQAESPIVQHNGQAQPAVGARPRHLPPKSSITVSVDRDRIELGSSFTITADIRPAFDREGALVVESPSNEAVAWGRTDSHGYITFRITPHKPGGHDYNVTCGVMGGGENTEGVSRTSHVEVNPDNG